MRRTPRFHSYDDVLGDAEAMHSGGYDRVGNWSLGQVCSHLGLAMDRAIDGFPTVYPAPFRWVARWLVLGKLLNHQQQKRRFPAPPYLVPRDIEEDRVGLEDLRAAVRRLKNHTGELKLHPVFGKLTPAQWTEFVLWHCEHHMSFLVPKKSTTPAAGQ
jgi:hypothetical protein